MDNSKRFANCPEGTTHLMPGSSDCIECWVKIEKGDYFFCFKHGNEWRPWREAKGFESQFIPKPYQFDIKRSPWTIRIRNEEEFNCVHKWLMGQGVDVGYIKYSNRYTAEYCITNRTDDGKIGWKKIPTSVMIPTEIKIDFHVHVSVKSVSYPDVGIAVKRIRELEDEIRLKAQELVSIRGW